MYVLCMYVLCRYVCICVLCMYACIYLSCIYVCMYTTMYIHMHTCVYMYVGMDLCLLESIYLDGSSLICV